jgi:lysophospholipase L1-like esterase
MISRRFAWCAGINIAIVLMVLVLLYALRFSQMSILELRPIFPTFYSWAYWIAHHTTALFITLFILFVVINGGTAFLAIKERNLHREAGLALFAICFTLAFTEIILKLIGYDPGIHTRVKYYRQVDSLYALSGFYADSLGIMKIDSHARKAVLDRIQHGLRDFSPVTDVPEVFLLASESLDMMEGKEENAFAQKFRLASKKNPETRSELEEGIVAYVKEPINEDGFRSIAFKQYESQKPKILLLGDSFTWGHSAKSGYNSFADELLSYGFVVYNTGITATDVAQYLAIAEHYIPILKPDIVIVNFYLGNDITYYKRDVRSFSSVFYATNAGILTACPSGICFDNAQDAYNFYLSEWKIPERDNTFNSVMAKSVITTLIWKMLLHLEIVTKSESQAHYFKMAERLRYSSPYCNEELKRIKQIAETNDARFILSVIPEVYTRTFVTKKDYPNLFTGLEPIEIAVSKKDYKLDDGHFNNRGHKRYAAFLTQHIEAGE